MPDFSQSSHVFPSLHVLLFSCFRFFLPSLWLRVLYLARSLADARSGVRVSTGVVDVARRCYGAVGVVASRCSKRCTSRCSSTCSSRGLVVVGVVVVAAQLARSYNMYKVVPLLLRRG